MASRRTRIKGIANIPQRRKNVNEDHTEPQIKSEGNSNLTSDVDTKNGKLNNRIQSSKEVKTEDTLSSDTLLNNSNSGDMYNENDSFTKDVSLHSTKAVICSLYFENEITTNTNDYTEDQNIEKHVDISSPSKCVSTTKDINAPLARRKFIKPAVSASVINRKPRQNMEKQTTQKLSSMEPSVEVETNENSKEINCVEQVIRNNTPTTNLPNGADTSTEIKNRALKPKPTIAIPTSNLGNEVTLEETHLTPQNKFNIKQEGLDNIRKIIPQTSNAHNSDTEYPPLPPSPSKVNRSRIKAIPRLSYRKTSFSASESEDESRRNYKRNRNDSVCSTASGAPESIAECMSPQRPKEIVTVSQKKCNRTEQSRKIAEARREFQRRFGANKPDKQRLTMIDLIFYNPTSNPMTNDVKAKEDKEQGTVQNNDEGIEDNSEKIDDPQVQNQNAPEDTNKSDEENEMPVPQIKIGPSGEIILDEKSLVIENKEVKKQREEMQKTQLIDGDFDTGYGIYKKQKRSKDWTQSETLRFYKALNTIGTDFSLMCELFPRRTRRELKMKFKKEEKINRTLIDRAVMQPCNFDFAILKHEVDMEEKELQELAIQKEEEVKLKKEASERLSKKRKLINEEKVKLPKIRKVKKPRIKKYKNIDSILENDDADESDIATQSESEDELTLPPKPTRSGRVPKLTKKFDIAEAMSIENVMQLSKVENQPKPNDIEPGSIMIITEKGPCDEPIYKIYMVTPDKNATPLVLNSDVVMKAIEFKKGITAQNILTISASTTDDEGEPEELPEENNYTIPADENVTSLKETNQIHKKLDCNTVAAITDSESVRFTDNDSSAQDFVENDLIIKKEQT